MDDSKRALTITEIHELALKEFASDPEAVRQLQDTYDRICREFFLAYEELIVKQSREL